jgi:hypothetical protein
MNKLTHKWLFLLLAGSFTTIMVSLFADETSPKPAAYADIRTLELRAKPSHVKSGPGQVLEVWIEDLIIEEKRKAAEAIEHEEIRKLAEPRKQAEVSRYLERIREERQRYDHAAIVISVKQQQSVLWLSHQRNFRILSVHAYDPQRAQEAPKDLQEGETFYSIQKVPADLRDLGPFYRPFPDKGEKQDFSKQVSSGPARYLADPGPRVGPLVPAFQFKATIEIQDPQNPKKTYLIDPHIMTTQ